MMNHKRTFKMNQCRRQSLILSLTILLATLIPAASFGKMV